MTYNLEVFKNGFLEKISTHPFIFLHIRKKKFRLSGKFLFLKNIKFQKQDRNRIKQINTGCINFTQPFLKTYLFDKESCKIGWLAG